MSGLISRHFDEIEADVMDNAFALLGTGVHELRNARQNPSVLHEERLIANIDGTRVTGRVDLYFDDRQTIRDIKVCSVWAKILGGKDEWEAQVNCYAYLYRRYGFVVDNLQIEAWYRDWSRREARYKQDYPQEMIEVLTVPTWYELDCYEYLAERIRLHLTPTWRECTDKERWARPAKWAVAKPSDGKPSKAYRLKETQEEAEEVWAKLKNRSQYQVEYRPGESVRCRDYCWAAPFCPQWAKLRAAEPEEESDTLEQAAVR